MPEADKPDLTTLTVQLLSAYVANNAVPNDALADLIRTTKAALADEDKVETPTEPSLVPAVSTKARVGYRISDCASGAVPILLRASVDLPATKQLTDIPLPWFPLRP